MSKYVILLGGELTITDRLIEQTQNAHFIAADSGIKHAEALGIEPELWLGDFDSSADDLQQKYAHINKQVHPTAKNKTDGEIAFDFACAAGASQIIYCGAFGGERTDHSLQHLTMATAQAIAGYNVFLTSGSEEAYPIIAGSYSFDLPENSLFSVIAFTELTGFNIIGADWPLNDVTVPFGSSLTLSNIVRKNLKISLQKGNACLIARPKLKTT